MEDRFAEISTRGVSLRLAYQSFGDEKAPVFLLVTGWFSDLTLWPHGFCQRLADRGYHVIRYDNRDSGLSTRTEIDVIDPAYPPYTMSDLAADAVGLMDALNIKSAHVAGFAMGGTIAQFIAIEYPDRVLTVTPVATATGARGFSLPDPSLIQVLAQPFPIELAELSRHHKKLFAAMAGDSFDETDYAERRAESRARGAPLARGDIQSAANRLSGDRTEKLKRVKVPALVVHAELDPLVSLEAAQAQVDTFPNGRLLVLAGTGHGILPESTWQTMVDAMDELAVSR